jgi:hypothetical protein
MSLNFDSLVYNNVSTKNGESSGMNTTNIVQSNLTRKVPYSTSSINFDGTSDLINFGNVDSLKLGAGDFTWSGWIHPYSWGSSWEAIYNCITTNGVWIGTDGTGSNFLLRIINGSNIITYSTLPTLNTWTNICITRVSGACSLYYNGISVATGTSTHNFNVSADVVLGSYSTSFGNFNGIISNVSIFEQGITQDDVINLYNNGITQNLNNFRVTPTAWYPLDQNSTYFNGSVLIGRDVINGNDGTGVNLIQSNIIGNAPSSENAGKGFAMASGFFLGKSKNSVNNSHSINMADYADGVTNPANSGRSTDTPS